MKILVNVTIETDPDDWTLAFGVRGPQFIRDHIREYVQEGLRSYGAFGNGERPAVITAH